MLVLQLFLDCRRQCSTEPCCLHTCARMNKLLPTSREFPPDLNDGDDPSKRRTTSSIVRGSAIAQPPDLKNVFFYTVYIVLISATTNFGQISAQTNFTILKNGYICEPNTTDANVLCLGGAHVYSGNSTSLIEAGRLSLVLDTAESLNTGVAYYRDQVRLLDVSTHQAASFNTSFFIDQRKWNVGDVASGDGMTFVINADNTVVGIDGGNLGIFLGNGSTPSKSIVVEFDTWHNYLPPAFDINDNHISFDFGNITYRAAQDCSNVGVMMGNVEATIYAWVEYSSKTQQLQARVSYINSRPVSPLLTYKVDLFDVIEEYMWVGFSAPSSTHYTNYYVGDWNFQSYYELLEPKSGARKLDLIVGFGVGIPALLLACIGIILLRSAYRDLRECEDQSMMQLEGMPERFNYKELCVATRDFSQESILGEGGFGSVYLGVLPSSGILVAVKKINSNSTQGEKEFMAEVSIISQLSHRNLIHLLGWCKDVAKGKYLLVYELMPNGSLDKVLFEKTAEELAESEAQPRAQPKDSPKEETISLSWKQRFNIVTGTAAALDYLHQGWTQKVIHRDIKASNIMLDKEWNAKLGDFGLARLVDHKKKGATTSLVGTCGYIAPEVPATGRFTDKSDVYAFGVVVLEVACGRKALSTVLPDNENVLLDWVWLSLNEGDLMRAVDKRLEDYDDYWMEVMMRIGLLCSHPDPEARPSMRQVVEILAGDIPVPTIQPFRVARVFNAVPWTMTIRFDHPPAESPDITTERTHNRVRSFVDLCKSPGTLRTTSR